MREGSKPVGATLNRLLKLSVPMLIANLSVMIMVAVDTYFVGTMGDPAVEADRVRRTEALAGLAFAGPLIWVVSSLFSGIIAAINTFAAQIWGEGRSSRLGLYLGQAVGLACLFSIPCAVVGLGAPAIFRVMPIEDPGVLEAAVQYARIRFSGLLFPLCNIAASGLFEGIGRVGTPTAVALFVNGLNAFLDWVLVRGNLGFPELGVAGAAWACVVSAACGSGVYLFLLLRPSFRRPYLAGSFRLPGGRTLAAFLRVGLPQGISWFLESALWAAFLLLVNTLGTVVASAQQIAVAILHFAFLPGMAVSTATTTLVGQAIGERNHQEAQRVFRCSLGVTVGYMGSAGLLFLLARDPLLRIFSNDPEVLAVGRVILLFAAFWQVFDGLYIASVGALRGAGDTVYPAVIYFGAGWLFFMPAAYLSTRVFGWGVVGAWGSAATFIAIAGVLAFLRWAGGKWRSLRITEEPLPRPAGEPEVGDLQGTAETKESGATSPAEPVQRQ